MLNNILNLEGVCVLNKKQKKFVKGGSIDCQFTIIENGTRSVFTTPVLTDDGDTASSTAQSACTDYVISHSGSRCFYDCEHDGYGQ